MCNLQIIDVVSEMFEERATGKYIMTHIFCDGEEMTPSETVKLLNEQQATIEELKAKLKEKEEDERLYANEILELRKTNEEWLQFKDLGGDY